MYETKKFKNDYFAIFLVSCSNVDEKKTFTREYKEVEIKYIAKSDIPSSYSKEKKKIIEGELVKETEELFFELVNSNLEYENTELFGRCVDWYEISYFYDEEKYDFLYIRNDYPFPFTNSSLIKEESDSLNVYCSMNYEIYWKMMKLIDKLEVELKDAKWYEVGWN